jgi:SAM-dependent methyltransferase
MLNYLKIQENGSDWSFGSGWGDQMETAILEWFGKSINDKTAKLLDAGCGEGRGVLALKNAGFQNVIGIDITYSKLVAARTRELNIVKTNIQNIPFKDNSFNFCFCSHTLEHMESIKDAIISLMRVTTRLFYIIPIFENKEFVKENNPSHVSPINNPNEFIMIVDNLNLNHKYEIKHRLGPELHGIISK